VVEGPGDVGGGIGGILLFRRPEGSLLLAGTWELPWVEAASAPGPGEIEPDLAAGLAERYGGRWRLGPLAARVRHGITYRDIEVDVHRAEVQSTGIVQEGIEAGWFDSEGRTRLPLSSLVGKVLAALSEAAAGAPVRGSRRGKNVGSGQPRRIS
jgi:adenine-specific DNA glycosylase